MARVTFEGKRYPLLEGETVLSGLLRGGATTSFSCKKGTCQSCMLEATRGDPGAQSRQGLRPDLRAQGYFLPCQSTPSEELEVRRPDPTRLLVRAHVTARDMLARDIVRLRLETETNFSWRAGQYVNLHHGGAVRSYSISSVPDEEPFLELHVKRVADGAMSRWLCDDVSVGEVLDIQGPLGTSFYEPESSTQPLLLVGAGTGLSPLYGIARDALAHDHRAAVILYHGARTPEGLYLRDDLVALQRRHERFTYVPCVSARAETGCAQGRASVVAFEQNTDPSTFRVYLAGPPEMVYDARVRAIGAGVKRTRIHADPFEPSHPFAPDDAEKVRATKPDPELWAALQEGVLLKRILTAFYDRVYEDARLAPYFHKVTKRRAIEKQYEFLASAFTGQRSYFGLNPFNAHHWMVISDELFDYREAMMEECIVRHELPPHLVRRWLAFHELFRREIVKSAPRGLIIDGVERHLDGYSEETISIGTICDGCGGEMQPGSMGRMHQRTGQLFCALCGARHVGATDAPPASTY